MAVAARYPALRVLARVQEILAWLSFLGGIALAAFAMTQQTDGKIIAAAMFIFGGVVGAVYLKLGAEMIRVAVDVEQNTRETALQAMTTQAAIRRLYEPKVASMPVVQPYEPDAQFQPPEE